MSSREKVLVLLIAGVLIMTGAGVMKRAPSYPDQIPPPVQNNLSTKRTEILEGQNGPVTLTLLAEYQITGVVKGRKNYRSDAAAEVSPMDLALAWGNLNQPAIDESISYSQSGRWYYYRLKSEAPVSVYDVQVQSANTHLIPKDNQIHNQLKKIGKRDLVNLEGYLVSVDFGQQRPPWTSSLTRTDSGDKSCEILYVTRVEIR